jgi:hypothetical protein
MRYCTALRSGGQSGPQATIERIVAAAYRSNT